MSTVNWLDKILTAFRNLTTGGVPFTSRSTLEVGSGLTATDDPTNDRVVLTSVLGITIATVKQAPYNATGNGTTDDTAALQTAFTAAADFFYPPGTYRIGSTGSVGSSSSVHRIESGASLVVDSGKTLTLHGTIAAGRHRIFAGLGAVLLANQITVFPEWWGAVPDGSTDCGPAIAAAIASLAAAGGGAIDFGAGVYLVVTPPSFASASKIVFRGLGAPRTRGFVNGATVLQDGRPNPSTYLLDISTDPGSRAVMFQDLHLIFPSPAKTAYSIHINTTACTFLRCKIDGDINPSNGVIIGNPATDPGLIKIDDFEDIFFQDCTFHGGTYQIDSSGTGSGGGLEIRNCHFYDCNGYNVRFESNGNACVRITGCDFDPLYRTTVPPLALDIRANGFVVENCSFYFGGAANNGPTSAQINAQGTGRISTCNVNNNSGGIVVQGDVEISQCVITAYAPLVVDSGTLRGGGNTIIPTQIADGAGAFPFDRKRGVIISDPYAGASVVDFGADSFAVDASVAAQALTGATNTTPIVVTSPALFALAQGVHNGDLVQVSGVTGNTDANGLWRLANVNAGAHTAELHDPVTGAAIAGNGAFGGASPTIQLVYYFLESYHVGDPSAGVSNLLFVRGKIRYDSAADQSLVGPLLGGTVGIFKLDPHVEVSGGGTLTHKSCGDLVTNDDFTGTITRTLPAAKLGRQEFSFAKRPDFVSGLASTLIVQAAGADVIELDGFSAGVGSVANTNPNEHNATLELVSTEFYDTAGTPTDRTRWYIKESRGRWGLSSLTQLPGALLVLTDSGIGLATGVNSWADQTGNGNTLTQSTGSKQPTLNATDAAYNGQATVSFAAGASQELDSGVLSSALNQPFTIYLCGELDDTGLVRALWSNQNGTLTGYGGGGLMSTYAGSVVQYAGDITRKCVMCWIVNGAQSQVFINNSQTPLPLETPGGTSNPGANGGTQFSLNSFGGVNTNYSNCKIASVAVCLGVHSAAVRQKAFWLLGHKYGVEVM